MQNNQQMKKNILILLFVLFVFYSLVSQTTENKGPNQTINDLVQLFKSYNKAGEDEKLTSKQKKENKKISMNIEKIFHYPSLINGTLRDQLDKMTLKQKKEFYNKFKELVELVAYPQASYFYNNSNTEFKKAIIKEGRAFIKSNNYNYDKDIEIDITFISQKIDNDWVMVDISMNEHSLIDAYRLQINRIVEKQGLTGLMNVFNKKHEELTKK